MDTDEKLQLYVYNDLINFDLSNIVINKGTESNLKVDLPYDYKVTLTDTINKLKSITYTTKMSFKLSSTSNWINCASIDGHLTTSKVIEFNNITLLDYEVDDYMEFDYGQSYSIDIRYETIHNYIVNDAVQEVADIIERTGLTYTRDIQPPNLSWSWGINDNGNVFDLVRGSCNYSTSTYAGDIVENCKLTVSNTGGLYTGIIKVYAYLRGDSVNMVTKVIEHNVSIPGNTTYDLIS